MIWLLVLICVTGIVMVINVVGNKETVRQKYINETIQSFYKEHKFTPVREYLSNKNNSLIAFSEDNKFCFIEINNALSIDTSKHQYKYTIVNSKSILEVEVFKDDKSIINVSKLGLVSGSVLGGTIAGNIGAIIGGLSANKNKREKIKELSLKVTVHDKTNPIQKITLFKSDYGVESDAKEVKDATNELEYWFNLLKVVIHENKNKIALN